MSLEPGTSVGRFRITRLIAQGGMAEVYRAEQELAGGIVRPAALKVIRPEYSESPDFREMFLDEARLACTLSHPNIVHIYEVGESDGRLYMAMELVPGESLAVVGRALRDSGERFGIEALLAVGIFTCSALESVHVLGLPGKGHVNLVHRDVSPHNLLLGPTGSLKLIDFGIAKAASNRNLTLPGVTKGKAGYFSPEQAMGKSLDGRSDLFSLGVTLYKLAWGGTPFDEYKTHHERNTALVHGRWVGLRQVCPGLPEGFYEIIDRALQVRPENRFADAYQMRAALERLAVQQGIHVGPSTLGGYVAPQPDDPLALGARPPQPTRSRPAPVVDPHAPTLAGPPEVATVAESGRRRHTMKLPAKQRPRRLYVGVGIAGVVLATVVGLFIGQLAAGAASRPAPKVEVQPITPAAAEKVRIPEPQVTAEVAPPEVHDVSAPPKPDPAQAQRREVRVASAAVERTHEPRAARAEARRPPASAASSETPAPVEPQGRGRLRIGGTDDGEILVNGKKWGLSPQDNYVASGMYSVVVKSLDGARQVSGTVQVRPDQTSIILFDFDRGSLSVR